MNRQINELFRWLILLASQPTQPANNSSFWKALLVVFSHPLTGTMLAILSIIAAYYLYRKALVVRDLVAQMTNTRLLGGSNPELPDEVTIKYADREISRLSKVNLVIWNRGKETITADELASGDLLRLVFEDGTEVFHPRVIKQTRPDIIKFQCIKHSNEPAVLFQFEFLDYKDGACIEILHTSNQRPSIRGTIRGMPSRVCTDLGSLPRKETFQVKNRKNRILRLFSFSERRLFPTFFIVAGILIAFTGLVPDMFIFFFPHLGKVEVRDPMLVSGQVNWLVVLAGLFYAMPGILIFYMERRKFPKELDE